MPLTPLIKDGGSPERVSIITLCVLQETSCHKTYTTKILSHFYELEDSSKLNGYTITSEVLTSNPITMNIRAAKPTKNTWHFLPGIGGKYMIYYPTPVGGNICLVNRG